MTKYILALDQGTTSSRAILFDSDQNIVGIEHDPMEIYSSQYAMMMELLTRHDISPKEIAGWHNAVGRGMDWASK